MWSATRAITRLNNPICAFLVKGVGIPFAQHSWHKKSTNMTVNRYILTRISSEGLHSSPFLHPAAAHLYALIICVAYLSLDYFNCTKDNMFRYLLEGNYQLLSYCQKYWIYHLDEYLRLGMPEALENISSSLSTFIGLRVVKGTRGISLHYNLEFSANLLIKVQTTVHQPLAVRWDGLFIVNMLVWKVLED